MKVSREITDITAHFLPLAGNDIIVTTFSNEIKRIGVNNWEHSFKGIKQPKLVYGNNLFVQQRQEGSLNEGTGCIDLKTGRLKELNFLQSSVLLTSLLQESKVLARHKDQNRKKIIQLIDLNLLKPDWEIDADLQFIWGFDKGILGQLRGKSEIVFVDFMDGEIMWHYDLSKLDTYQDFDGSEKQIQITKILEIHEDKIYILLNSGKLLLLGSKSGEKITILKNDKHAKFDTFGNSIEIDILSNKLIQLANQDLIEVDLKSLEVSITPIEDMKSSGLENFSFFAYDSNHIYFTDKDHQTLGAVNRATHKLDWTHKLSQEGISESERPRYGRELKLNGDRLYVLDNKHTLHIFEKEAHPGYDRM